MAASRLHLGTSGYSYNDWKGVFYPVSCRQQDMLSLYAQRFSTVELNFSYYRQPEPQQLVAMANKAGAVSADFTFALKAYRALTHEIGADWLAEAERFHTAANALAQAGRLGAVLLQFPHSFHYTVQNRRHLGALLEALEPLPRACEFRSREWLRPRVYEGLRAREVALAAVDEPQLDGLLPPLAVPTAPLGYVRFHGRNRENWWHGDNASRYDYLYSPDELREWLPRLQELFQSAESVYVYFNNHWRGQATENAALFERLVVEEMES